MAPEPFGSRTSALPRALRGLLLATLTVVGSLIVGPSSALAQSDECVEVSVMEIACIADAPGDYTLSLTVTNLGFVPSIEHLFLNDATLPIAPAAFEVPPLGPGDTTVLTVTLSGASAGDQLCFLLTVHDQELVECCSLEVCVDVPSCGTTFIRGDCNADGGFDISDAIAMLSILFSGAPAPPCDDACDANDDGAFNIGDAVYVLANLFSGGPPPAAPHPNCGADPTPDSLDCLMFPPCP